jgi:formylglycine-generating enzyme
MKKQMVKFLMFIFGSLNAFANETVIQSIDQNGSLSFSEISNATSYRVEWSPAVESGWTNFAGDYANWLDNIPATGSGVITAGVPMFYRVVATVTPDGMVYIPAGSFMMGNATNMFPAEEGYPNELPQHEVYIDAFYMDKYEVSVSKSIAVRIPSSALGYTYANTADYLDSDKPVKRINWYDAVKWCNARSEMEGLIPVYYTEASFTNVYRSGTLEPFADWSANGYRLPTEAEWEKAARGGIPDTRFPWNDYENLISHLKANYYAGGYPYDYSLGYHPAFSDNVTAFPSPVGYFAPNNYGLYDMAGNISEWVWDWFGEDYYTTSPTSNPQGPTTGTFRILRGGAYTEETIWARVSARYWYFPFTGELNEYMFAGFRCVRRP